MDRREAQSRDEDTRALSAGTSFDTEITSPESGDYNHQMIGTFEVGLTDALDFDLTLVWDRINKPRANADGSVPKQDDYRVIFGVGYDF